MSVRKIVTFSELTEVVADLRAAGKRIVSTNGCFDILHVGHIRNISEARELGDVLIIGINSDASVRENKGSARPIVSECERAEVLASLEAVDYVFIFNERTPFQWIEAIRPDIHVKGGGEDIQNHPDFLEQKKVIESVGGKFVLVSHHDGSSTTSIIERIRTQK